ncbi:uncharacterized protein B0I36DRAFT_387065 [Microdochium trichocladiopsis]|uniref:NAD-dependent epimerase/dehydratase domain-containing protein n=1 Tax=Microdochium trichocladiopsis TaxID=1682393 RepID=A0A9P9BL29_9PEZI|nr:uncharacterized protein B0I36DRAFT_387065 [Microdochium trichocladiopsis]KAH7024507.1 hypothetical protein B0I36DRAFT_387065 [Microdochium trichocladiopsis]
MAAQNKLLITGVTGYIGFQTLIIALERNHNVRAVVRSQANIAKLRSMNARVAKSQDDGVLEFAIVPNFLAPNDITSALDGITEIIHLASPLAAQADDYEREIIAPAVDMVTVVLEAATQTPSVRRLVITSSCVTLVPFEWNFAPDSERTYSADDINSHPTQPYGNPMEAYWASKALARIATRDFVNTKKPHFDYINLLPSVVIGPDTRIPSDGTAKPGDLTAEARGSVLASALDASLNSPFPFVGVPVHVRDVARAHVDAAVPAEGQTEIAGNAEYILSSDAPEGVVWDRDTPAIARKYFPEEVANGTLPLEGSLTAIKWRLDTSKTEEAFGWKMTTFEQTMKEMLLQYIDLKNGR